MNFHLTHIAAALAAAALCLPAAAKEYRSADVHPEDYPTVMAVKFMTIVGYFMHLKHDAPLFKLMFYIGLVLAIAVFGIMLTTFHFFIT